MANTRPTRAIVLTIVSRLALAVVLAVAGAGAWSALVSEPAGPGPRSRVTGPVQVPADAADPGSSMAALVAGIESALVDTSSSLVSLDAGRPEARWAPVRLAVDVPGGPGDIAQVLAALDDAGVTAASADTVVATPNGSRTDITGKVRLSDRRIAGGPESDDDGQLAVVLAEDVERAGVHLRRLDVDEVDGRLVRLEVEGRVDGVVPLLATIERRYAAPTRFDSLTSRRIGTDLRAVSIVFRPREGLR